MGKVNNIIHIKRRKKIVAAESRPRISITYNQITQSEIFIGIVINFLKFYEIFIIINFN